jgi:hypothetical protein
MGRRFKSCHSDHLLGSRSKWLRESFRQFYGRLAVMLAAYVAIICRAAASAHFDADTVVSMLDTRSWSWLRQLLMVGCEWERARGKPKTRASIQA